MNKETFKQGIDALSKVWPETAITPDLLEVYGMVLMELHETAFIAAIQDCLKTCKFFPKPAEIYQRAIAALEGSGAFPKSGEAAWAEVLEKARQHNWISGVTFSEPLIEQAVRAIGGINRVAEAERTDVSFLRREFIEFYDQKREQEVKYGTGLIGLPLPGERDRLVGEGIKAMTVLRGGKL